MTQTVGKVYAEALFLLAKEEHKEEQVWKELNEVADVMAQNPEFVTLLDVRHSMCAGAHRHPAAGHR